MTHHYRVIGADSDTYEAVTANDNVTSEGWAKLTGTFTISKAMVASSIRIESGYNDSNTPDYYLDSITFTLHMIDHSEPAKVQSYKYDFEDGTEQGWSPRLSCTVEATAADKMNGAYSLLVWYRDDNMAGPIIDVSGKMRAGSKYNISTWLKLAPGYDKTEITISM
jgi:endo-1,4-beta-xylanase